MTLTCLPTTAREAARVERTVVAKRAEVFMICCETGWFLGVKLSLDRVVQVIASVSRRVVWL